VRITLAVILVLVAASAQAGDRGFVQGVGGVTFMSDRSGVFGGEAAFHVTPDLVVFGQAGRMTNVLPRDIQEDIDGAAALLESFTGRTWHFDAAIRATYVGGGARYFVPAGPRVRLYVTGGAAMIRYAGSLRERELGDVLDEAVSLGIIESGDVEGTEIGYEAGGGVLIPAGRMQVDAGYRLMNVRGVNISRAVVGAGFRF
jgi:Outer membrane protein beta-barrel domain